MFVYSFSNIVYERGDFFPGWEEDFSVRQDKKLFRSQKAFSFISISGSPPFVLILHMPD